MDARWPLPILTLAACGAIAPTSEDQQNASQEQTSQQAVKTVGFPSIVNFREKRELREIYEMRDKAINTYAYVMDWQGHFHKFCDSIGYGIPYSTQFSNPQQTTGYAEHEVTIGQAEPNGLYAPTAAAGTWVDCVNPKTGQTKPVYVEPDVIVSQFPLQTQ